MRERETETEGEGGETLFTKMRGKRRHIVTNLRKIKRTVRK